ncbi:MAG TPA: hypothetical protein VIJ92_08640 [Ginsengibacter sp.]
MLEFSLFFYQLTDFSSFTFFKVLYQIDLHLLEFISHERIKPLDTLKRQSWLILISLGINTVIEIIKRVVSRQRPYKVDFFIEKYPEPAFLSIRPSPETLF